MMVSHMANTAIRATTVMEWLLGHSLPEAAPC